MKMNEEQIKEFREVTKPVIKFLQQFNPYCKIIIENNHSEFLEGIASEVDK